MRAVRTFSIVSHSRPRHLLAACSVLGYLIAVTMATSVPSIQKSVPELTASAQQTLTIESFDVFWVTGTHWEVSGNIVGCSDPDEHEIVLTYGLNGHTVDVDEDGTFSKIINEPALNYGDVVGAEITCDEEFDSESTLAN